MNRSEAINIQMTKDFNSILGGAERELLKALKNYTNLSQSEINNIMSDQTFIKNYLSKHCLDLFSLGWMIGLEESVNKFSARIEKMGAESKETLNELLVFLQNTFSTKIVIDIFHDIGLGFFNNGHYAGSQFK
ncbi:hypothetical protein [Pseudalkalibacillus caeni]|uniref:Uncharacterized protein n=1 Tax=Exobacillus caeni TaxID=2574798 RepID=A0A5R9F8E3_9BACL|nr:hypothetical protein [Pseudalkalibacillus caeni]TLS38586.1 hypothetical protein FCL54_03545 [Pseudalkalibacillus caeni]